VIENPPVERKPETLSRFGRAGPFTTLAVQDPKGFPMVSRNPHSGLLQATLQYWKESNPPIVPDPVRFYRECYCGILFIGDTRDEVIINYNKHRINCNILKLM
jgi:hypothetical protein